MVTKQKNTASTPTPLQSNRIISSSPVLPPPPTPSHPTQAERRRLAVLGALSERYASLGPALRDMGGAVAELKAYLQSVYDADLLGDPVVQDLATGHAVGFTVRLLEALAEPGGAGGVVPAKVGAGVGGWERVGEGRGWRGVL